ncbi:nucleotidyl transferase AbiEii/AbiGii toxin family protein [Candidatus Uhrbacteria bacterium]|nr:nucleotidyl transferase AbiEii/AbiGii toxin family protein [Candidatus Uhrbacteria bacterium]
MPRSETMHKEILTSEQVELLPLVGSFSKEFGLVGGTAVALQLGHRRSIDFDLFSFKGFNNLSIKQKISRKRKIDEIYVNRKGEFTFLMNGVKVTFFHYPFELDFSERFDRVIRMPDLLTLAAMKAYTLGQRAKWKDYVDLYFIMQKYHGISAIAEKAETLFGNEFNEKLFRTQLTFFQDINYAEKVEYLPGFEVEQHTIEKALENYSVS